MLKETRYNVLIVSSNEKLNSGITKLLLSSSYNSPVFANSLNQANRLLLERSYDILIVNSPVGDQKATNFCLSVTDSYNVGVILLVPSLEYGEAFDKTNSYGILTLSKPTPTDLFLQSLQLLCSTREKLTKIKKISKSDLSFKEKMEEIKLSNEAKLLLMKHKGMSEEEAHKFIEKRAMNLRIPKTLVAKEIITKYR